MCWMTGELWDDGRDLIGEDIRLCQENIADSFSNVALLRNSFDTSCCCVTAMDCSLFLRHVVLNVRGYRRISVCACSQVILAAIIVCCAVGCFYGASPFRSHRCLLRVTMY